MTKRQLAAFLLRFAASVAVSLLVRLTAIFPITGWLLGAIALLLLVRVGILAFKWVMYRVQLNSPHYHYNSMSNAAYGGVSITVEELAEETIGLSIWATAILFGGFAAWYSLMV
ncbi:MAG: hypothetical protein HC781_23290 [Leptolyngbyaceae cyanobacterium CSU_1_4]|nr:hypothetical protein [Leptolyngbyaceae cyanobacterium CSU_1_4]